MSREAERLKSEERRALVVLGLTAILASFLSAMLSTVWSSNGKINETDFFFNFPPVRSPTPHITYYWIPILEFMIGSWMVYAILAFWYFSVDWLSLRVRNAFHVASTIFLGFYVLTIVPSVPLIYIGIVWITQPTEQIVYFFFAITFLATLELDFVKWALGVGNTAFIPRVLRELADWFRRRRTSSPEPSSQLGV
jgi:hypothetical protein